MRPWKNGIIAADAVVDAYLAGRTQVPYKKLASDADAAYASVHEIDVSRLEPQVARPHSPANVVGGSDQDPRFQAVHLGIISGTTHVTTRARWAPDAEIARVSSIRARFIVVPPSATP